MRGSIQAIFSAALLVLLCACGSATPHHEGGAVPDGVDPQLWAKLTAALESYQRSASAAGAPAQLPRPSELTWHADTHELTWAYELAGDYNQDGEVTPADLVPLAQHFGKLVTEDGRDAFPYWAIEAVIDGDRNGEIGLGDLTVLGRNLGSRIDSYALSASAGFDAYPLAELRETYPGPGSNAIPGTLGYEYEYRNLTPAAVRAADPAQITERIELQLTVFTPAQRQLSRLELHHVLGSAPVGLQTFWLRSASSGVSSGPSLPAMRPLPETPWPMGEEWGISFDQETQLLRWRFWMLGNGDCNEGFSPNDLVPLSLNMFEHGPWESERAVRLCDTDGDLLITYRDLRGIAHYWQQWLSGYRVYGSNFIDSATGKPIGGEPVYSLATVADAQFILDSYATLLRPYYMVSLLPESLGGCVAYRYCWVVPVCRGYEDGQEVLNEGPPSPVVTVW